MITVVMIEIHMGVMVSPAPRITPERIWVIPIAMYPTARIRIIRTPVEITSGVEVNISTK